MPARIIGVQRSERNRTLLTAVHQSVPVTRDDMHVHSRLLSGARVTTCSSVAVVLLRRPPVEGEALQARLSTRGARPESRSGCHSHADCQSRVRKKQRITTAAQPPAALRVLMARTCL